MSQASLDLSRICSCGKPFLGTIDLCPACWSVQNTRKVREALQRSLDRMTGDERVAHYLTARRDDFRLTVARWRRDAEATNGIAADKLRIGADALSEAIATLDHHLDLLTSAPVTLNGHAKASAQ